jgi:hypothetical protein
MPLPYWLVLAQRFFHGFETHPDRWFGLRLSLFKGRKMRIVAMGAIIAYRLPLPAVDALAVRPEIPILLAVGVALTADPPGFVEADLAVTLCVQEIPILVIVAGEAPEAILPMVQTDAMYRGEFVRDRVGLPISMTLGTGIEDELLLTGWYLRGGTTLEARDSVFTNDCRLTTHL